MYMHIHIHTHTHTHIDIHRYIYIYIYIHICIHTHTNKQTYIHTKSFRFKIVGCPDKLENRLSRWPLPEPPRRNRLPLSRPPCAARLSSAGNSSFVLGTGASSAPGAWLRLSPSTTRARLPTWTRSNGPAPSLHAQTWTPRRTLLAQLAAALSNRKTLQALARRLRCSADEGPPPKGRLRPH